jgi:hypothetical protein
VTLLYAINVVATYGGVMVSCVGKWYSAEALACTWRGKHYASFRSCGMTKEEREGAWRFISALP